jgi:chromosome partitioning protein
MTARVIAVANRKGSVGKTTTVTNLAAELGSRGRRVLVVDLDTQGHASLGLGVVARSAEPGAHGVFRDPPLDIASSIRASDVRGVQVLPPEIEFQVYDSINDPFRLARALSPLADDILTFWGGRDACEAQNRTASIESSLVAGGAAIAASSSE